MIKIGELTFDSSVSYGQKAISIVVPADTTAENIEVLKNATLLEIINDGVTEGSYRLVTWQRIEKVMAGIMFTWQTVSADEIDTLKAQVQTLQTNLGNTTTALTSAQEEITTIMAAVEDIQDLIERGEISEAKAILDILLGEEESETNET